MSDYMPNCVFVSGATAGFGSAFARRFARAGAKVVITGRRADRLAALKTELGDRAHSVVLDVRDRERLTDAVGETSEVYVMQALTGG